MDFSDDLIYGGSNNPILNPICNDFNTELNNTSDVRRKLQLIIMFSKNHGMKYQPFVEDITNKLICELKTLDDSYLLGWCYFFLSKLKMDSAQYRDGLVLLDSARVSFEIHSDENGLLHVLSGEGNVYVKMGIYDKGFEKYLTCLEIAKKQNNSLRISAVSNNIGILFNKLKQYDTAKEYFEKALAIKNLPAKEKAIQYCNLARTHRCLGNYQQAKKAVLKSLLIAKQYKHDYPAACSLLEIGILNYQKQNTKKARNYLGKALYLANKLDFQMVKGKALLQLGLIEKDADIFEEALALLSDALSIFTSNSAKDYEAVTLLAISETYGALGDHHNAFLAATSGKNKKDQIFNEEVTYLMNIMRIKQSNHEDFIYKGLYQQIKIISEMGRAITSTLDVGEIGRLTYKHISNLMNTNKLLIGLFSDNLCAIEYNINIQDGDFLPSYTYIGEQELYLAIEYLKSNDTIINTDDTIKKYSFADLLMQRKTGNEDLINSYISCPLRVNNKLIGFITVQSKNYLYSLHDADMLKTIAVYIAIALENEKYFSQASKLANIDTLTGLYNRQNTLEKAEQEFSKHKEQNSPFSVILIDIHRLTFVNDNYGRPAGDKVLQGVSEVFKSTIRDTDILGRVGEDEFLIILPNTTIDVAIELGAELSKNISKIKFLLDKAIINVKTNLGVANLEEIDHDVNSIINRAGDLLLNNKNNSDSQKK